VSVPEAESDSDASVERVADVDGVSEREERGESDCEGVAL
jgi:hypothetical protein